jgi:hypothetical protein
MPSKRTRANTAGDTLVVTAESLLKSLASITLEAQGNLGTNPNADPLGLVLLDGCEDARASRVEIKSPHKNVDLEREPQNVNLRVHIF